MWSRKEGKGAAADLLEAVGEKDDDERRRSVVVEVIVDMLYGHECSTLCSWDT